MAKRQKLDGAPKIIHKAELSGNRVKFICYYLHSNLGGKNLAISDILTDIGDVLNGKIIPTCNIMRQVEAI